MRDLLRADLYRMFRGRWFWLCLCGMVAAALALIAIQRSAMEYAVALDRVVFLPMAFYGVAVAALIALFVGDDFHGGMIRNKLVAGRSRSAVYFSAQGTCWLGCMAVYTLTTATAAGVGAYLFPANVTAGEILRYYCLGLLTCAAYGSAFCMASMLCRSRSMAAVVCMASAFAMLFLCLHTNQVVIQEALKDGLPNPAYVTGAKRTLYLLAHDLNPGGQAAQLSAMRCLDAPRFIAADLFWVCLSALVGARAFAGSRRI